jgi:hypothetical protein
MGHTTPNSVRNLLPDLLTEEDDLGVISSGTSLTLTNSAYAVPTILKDASTLAVTTDYTFVQPRKITLTAAATGENFTAHVHVAFSDDELKTFIGESDRIINNLFANLSMPDSTYLDDWSKWLTAHKVILIKAKGNLDKVAWGRSFRTMAMDAINDYIANTSATSFNDAGGDRADATSVSDFMLDQQPVSKY